MTDHIKRELTRVEDAILESLRESRMLGMGDDVLRGFCQGKFLRSKLGLKLVQNGGSPASDELVNAFAAVEMVHSASLIHDDIIDTGDTRRGKPTWWRELGASSAVIMGDYLFCMALKVASRLSEDCLRHNFTPKIGEMCEGEFEQECLCRGKSITFERCQDINRKKTGALFAIIARACVEGDEEKIEALEKVGYATGTAYQFIDDMLDEFSTEARTGKTLGLDRRKAKPTAVQFFTGRESELLDKIEELLTGAEETLTSWPSMREGYHEYIEEYFRPFINELADLVRARAQAAL